MVRGEVRLFPVPLGLGMKQSSGLMLTPGQTPPPPPPAQTFSLDLAAWTSELCPWQQQENDPLARGSMAARTVQGLSRDRAERDSSRDPHGLTWPPTPRHADREAPDKVLNLSASQSPHQEVAEKLRSVHKGLFIGKDERILMESLVKDLAYVRPSSNIVSCRGP